MSTLVVGDVHGCDDELQALLDQVGPDRVVLVGDVYTKGPHPARVHASLERHGIEVVRGNHDERLLHAAAGGRPDDAHAHQVIAELHAVDPDWAARVGSWPLWREAPPFLVTHAGLHPSGDLERTTREMHLYRRRWPRDDDAEDPFWWEVYHGPPVIFGHDARRGFVRRDRDGQPWVLGLDTGCVYGGELTGWEIERARRVSVPARRAYAPIGG